MSASKNTIIGLLLSFGLTASQVHASVSKRDAVEFVHQYQQALLSRDADTLNYLMAADARIRIELEQPEGGRQQFTLTAPRFLQQIRAIWHFAGSQKLEFSAPEYSRDDNDSMIVTMQQVDRRVLFGQQTRQQDSLTIRLDRQSGQIRIVELNSVSRLW
jgi:hypothetical protein